MTAEEVAIEEFREAVRGARVARRDASHGSRVAIGMHASKLGAVRVLARIIRAIRAERTPFHAMEKRLAGSIEGGIEAGIALIKARAYAQGRRDALRGVQAAALYRHAELWQGRVRLTSADERRDIEACELAWAAAQAAEEAAR